MMTQLIQINKKKLETEIKNIKNIYTTNEIINSFIKLFLISQKREHCDVKKLQECNKYEEDFNEVLLHQIQNNYLSLSLKDLEAVFESLIDFDRKKAEGAVYTPDYIIDYILNYSLSIYKGTEIPTVCDPSCGSGGFIVRSIEIIANHYNISIEQSIPYVKGIDINPQSVSCAKIIVELYCISKGITIPSLDNNIICADTLLSSKEELFNKLKIKNGIDILATNPPYVKLQNISNDYRKHLIEKYPKFTKGSFSFAMLFLIAGKNLLSDNGVLGYITQNNFFTSLASKNIREYLQEKKSVHTIIDFLHTKIFENASAYTCLMFLTKDIKESIKFKWALNPLLDLPNKDFSKIIVEDLDSKKWRLAPSPHLENIYKMEHIGNKLGNIADIKVGFATLKDKVFLLDKNTDLDIEEDICVSAIKTADLSDEESFNSNYRKIIFPYKKINDKFIPYNEEEMRHLFPKAYQYLLNNKEILNTRSEGKIKLTNFYEWGRIQGMEAPENKLLTKTFSGKPNFMLDKSSSVFCNGYSIKPKKFNNTLLTNDEIDILILQKILNSSIMDYYSKLTSFQLNGNYQCFQKNFIELFNIPNLTAENIDYISNAYDEKLDIYLSNLYKIDYNDILEIINR